MKVEFDGDEVQQLFDVVIDQLVALKLDKTDRATLRRWRSESMTASAPAMQLLAEKINGDIQRSHDLSVASPIKKPDWAG
jgi:hypothetical protein